MNQYVNRTTTAETLFTDTITTYVSAIAHNQSNLLLQLELSTNILQTTLPTLLQVYKESLTTGLPISVQLEERQLETNYFTTKKRGTGIGLAFCKKAMQMIGGTIEVFSVHGDFIEFKLIFPEINL